MKRILVIGDIHGGLRALVQVLERAAVSTEDRLVFLGDFVDGWSESAQVIDYVMALAEKQDCIFLKGNHDEWCEEWLRTDHADKTWLLHGGQATIKSYAAADRAARSKHLQFFEAMHLYYTDDQNRLFVHAGFTSMHGPQKEAHPSNVSWDRTLWEMAMTIDKNIAEDSLVYPRRLKLFREIYIGHTPTLYFNVTTPMQGCNVWNIDTGAAFTGRLSILDVDTKAFWQSDPLKQLYPDEMGRNRD
ncbi:MAG: metallophosphoesterase family protein [Chitinophagaceae bacterium]